MLQQPRASSSPWVEFELGRKGSSFQSTRARVVRPMRLMFVRDVVLCGRAELFQALLALRVFEPFFAMLGFSFSGSSTESVLGCLPESSDLVVASE